MAGAWEPIGGLEEEDTADEIGLSFQNLEMVATLVNPANSYVWAFTGQGGSSDQECHGKVTSGGPGHLQRGRGGGHCQDACRGLIAGR